ncbi:hypothetical protein BJV78DRAFT_117308 [Lactifluus subvellereus]|nr:hypothetical protein BJV78DRAFT_117308 [Lactifluus subvellereus]
MSPLCLRKICSKPPRALSSPPPLHARTCPTGHFLLETLFEGRFPRLRAIASKFRRPLSSHHCPHSRAHHPSCCPSENQFAGSSLGLREIPSKLSALLSENSNPVSSGQTDGRGDVAMNGIPTSLAALKDGSALVANVPYISPIAGLLQTLMTRDGVKQCKVEWGIRSPASRVSLLMSASCAEPMT